MAENETPVFENPDNTTAKIQKGYGGAAANLDKTIAELTSLRSTLLGEASNFSQLAELRAREEDTYRYTTTTDRQRTLAAQKLEDDARELAFKGRVAELEARERDIAKKAAEELENQKRILIQREVAAATTALRAELEKEYDTKKKIDEADQRTKMRELELQNAALTDENKKLHGQLSAAIAAQKDAVQRMESVATRATDAAAGIKARSDESLSRAVEASTSDRRGR